ncbi:hypothetical protein [Haloarchaeobius baliensis]|uniref:hypothetical protein n=1 Tax=Haloarchaeobius baliensis TaxID=1670458 RepID=UPI003F881002
MVERDDSTENLSTVGSGRVDELFDEIDTTVGRLDELADELESLRRRIEANEGETSGHVKDRVTADADGLTDEAAAASERLAAKLEALKRTV